MPNRCIFCEMVEDRERAPHWIAESDGAFAFLDIHPIRRGHSLVIPKVHAEDLSDVTAADLAAVMNLTHAVARGLRRQLGTTGENIFVASGPGSEQSVFHLHVHVIPRTPEDDLRWNEWWQTKVLRPEMTDLVAFARGFRRHEMTT